MPSRLRRQVPAFEPRTGWSPAPRSQVSGSQFAWPANSSSLLFSCTGVNSFIHLALHRFSEGVFSDFVEGHSVHSNLLDAAVIQLIPFAQKIRPRLRVGDHGDHPVGSSHDSIQPQRVDLQSRLARRERTCFATALFTAYERFERITLGNFGLLVRRGRRGRRGCCGLRALRGGFLGAVFLCRLLLWL